MPIACPADAEGCSDTSTWVFGPGFDAVLGSGLIIVAVIAVIVAVVLIRRRS